MPDLFAYPVEAVTRFIENAGFFAMLLDDGQIVKHTPDDADRFRKLLREAGATDISPSPSATTKAAS